MEENIDILLATYNGEKYIKEQIESILNQTYKNINLIISDDCSTDNTRKILTEYTQKDKRITVYFQNENQGYIKNFEFLLKQVKNPYYMLSDQDDVWLPEKVEKSIKTLKEKKVSDIRNRVKIGNNSSADIFVSIHLNKIPQPQYSGWQCFYQAKSEQSQKLAKSIQKNLNETIQKENNRVAMKLDNVYIIKHVEIPLSIVECGFLSNPEEEKQLLDNDYQDHLAWGIYMGIINYFN